VTVVVAGCSHSDLILSDLVDEPVLVGDSARPVTLKPVLERLGFSEFHSIRSRAVPPPDSSRSIAVSNRRAFSGLRRRKAVSFSDS
jgi:hypothetical protein